MKQAIVESAREVCGVGRKNPKSVWWNEALKAVIKRKEDVWKQVLGARDESAKGRCMEVYKEEKRREKIKRYIHISQKKQINESFVGR